MRAACDLWGAALGVRQAPQWAAALAGTPPLQTRRCRRVVVVAVHLEEELCAAGGLLARLADRRLAIDLLGVTGGDGLSGPQVDTRHLTRRRARQRENYRRLGADDFRRHRLDLPCGLVADSEPDVVAALSEIIGFVRDPEGLWCLAPWRHDGHPDHDAAGRAAETACGAYRVRLVRYVVSAWTTRRPEDLPWGRVRQVRLDRVLLDRKRAAIPADVRRSVAPLGSRELYLV
jgi:LmbE family N-acetylglucosaminyl deacetylase